jgi:hypothetical protein
MVNEKGLELEWQQQGFVRKVSDFIEGCRLDPESRSYASCWGGPETLYASAFACMLMHYLGTLQDLSEEERYDWADYFNGWQDSETGYFVGPELVKEEMGSRIHSYEHIAHHLTAHVLPALALLGHQPRYPLAFARPYLDTTFLKQWLGARDWRDAWLEGNNLLFVGQFLIHLRDVEGERQTGPALARYFDWLDERVDPATGLWGSNGYCSNADALYGGYHQLLVYYHEGRPVQHRERLVDVALSLQHGDGGFHPRGGGGACQDVDAIDILINLYKQLNYRRAEIRLALRRALVHIKQRQMPEGGFVYRLDQAFTHMGLARTTSAANRANLFPTWFRVHTLTLIGEILTDEPELQRLSRFNDRFSMGWHPGWDRQQAALTWRSRQQEQLAARKQAIERRTNAIVTDLRREGRRVKRQLLKMGNDS